MNTLLKVSAAGVLALGAVAAHAGGIVGGKSSSTPGDLLLFAEVVNSSNVAQAFYVGDTNISVSGTPASGLSAGTLIKATGAGSDANLAAFLAAASVAGSTIEWAVQGAGYSASGDAGALTTVSNSAALAQLQSRTGTNVGFMITGLTGAINNTINPAISGAGKSYEGTAAKGWDTTAPQTANGTNIEAWFNNGTLTALTGLGTSATLYSVTAPYAGGFAVAGLGNVSLTAAGLTYSAVPLPPAVWLLGSGLLGLAGISRRKASRA